MKKMRDRSRRLLRFFRASRAVSALEYAILVGVIAVGIEAALATFQGQIETALENVGNSLADIQGLGTGTGGAATGGATP